MRRKGNKWKNMMETEFRLVKVSFVQMPMCYVIFGNHPTALNLRGKRKRQY